MHDIAIIGGGINGCGIARDAAGRGYSVLLAEQDDLASGTSSWSTKLIHGGLRYLEYYEFRLVREALKEREVLWSIAPHIIAPARFVLPHHRGLRPAWLLRIGLFLYDHIGGRERLPGTRTLDLGTDIVGEPLKSGFARGFEYSDCRVDDARLVVLNARDAANRGADIRTRNRVMDARRENGHWRLTLGDLDSGKERTETARLLVNAAGPWVDAVRQGVIADNREPSVRLVKGSHIVVPKMFDHDRGYIFQNSDGRIVFALPYEDDYTLVGTTDEDYSGDPGDAAISDDETRYLCSAVSDYFEKSVAPEQVVWSFSGVRPLYDDGASKAQEATRDYVIKTEGSADDAPLVNIFGGKLTTYRTLSETVLAEIGQQLGRTGTSWTGEQPLPGGDFPADTVNEQIDKLLTSFSFLERPVAQRLVRTYGTLAAEVLGGAKGEDDLGTHFGAGLFEREVDYLMAQEWARTAEDILWRRTKLGLRLTPKQVDRLRQWLTERHPKAQSSAA